MERKKLVLITSGPGRGLTCALELAAKMKAQGQEVDVCLLEDAVLCARRGDETHAGRAVGEALRAGIGLLYLEEDLVARGFGREDVRVEGRPLGYGDLVELMLEDERVTLGAF